MTYPGIENPINTAEDILTSGYDIKIYNYGGSETAAFEATQNPAYQNVWKSKTLVKSVGLSGELRLKYNFDSKCQSRQLEARETK